MGLKIQRTLHEGDMTLADVAAVHGTWASLGYYQNNMPNAKVTLGGKDAYINLVIQDDTPAAEPCLFRIIATDPNSLKRFVVWQGRPETTNSATDKTQKVKLDLTPPSLKYLSKFLFEVNIDAAVADTIDVSECTIQIGVTVEYA